MAMSEDDSLALTRGDDETEDTHDLMPLPSVKYTPGLEYDERYPCVVKDLDRVPQIDDILGTYNVLISSAGGCYRQYHEISSDDEESLEVTRTDDGSLKFELICKENKIENRSNYQGWTCIEQDYEEGLGRGVSIYIENPRVRPYNPRYGPHYGWVRFVDRRGAIFYAGKEPHRERSRYSPSIMSMDHAENKLVDFARESDKESHWIHQHLGLPIEVVAEVQQFLVEPNPPPPVFFFERGDLCLSTEAWDDSYADVFYVARKVADLPSPPERNQSS